LVSTVKPLSKTVLRTPWVSEVADTGAASVGVEALTRSPFTKTKLPIRKQKNQLTKKSDRSFEEKRMTGFGEMNSNKSGQRLGETMNP
jgi:hypothetical protein